MLIRRTILYVIAIVAGFLPAWAANGKQQTGVRYYDRWSSLPSRVLSEKGAAFMKQGDKFDSALVCYSVLANRYYEKRIDRGERQYALDALCNLGKLHMLHYYDYKKAYKYLLMAERMAKEYRMTDQLASIYLAQANVMQMGQLDFTDDDVMQMLRQAYDAAMADCDWEEATFALYNLLSKGMKMDNVAPLLAETHRFLAAHGDTSSTLGHEMNCICRAAEAFSRHDYELAGDCYMQMRQSDADGQPQDRHKMNVLLNAGEMYNKARATEKARRVLTEAMRVAEQEGNLVYLRSIYLELSITHACEGDTAGQQHYELLHLRAKDSLYTAGQLANLQSVKFANEVDTLNEQVRRLDRERQQQIMLLTVALLVIAVVSVLSWRLYKSNKRIEADRRLLYQNNVELLRREEEQRRLAVLHHQQGHPRPGVSPVGSQPHKARYQGSQLDHDDEQAVFDKVSEVMATSPEVYSFGFSLNRLSELCDLRLHYVSQAINAVYGNNFNALLNDYRIREACRRMNDADHYGHLSIEGLAQGVGFKSRTSFAAIFKQYTGLTPSEYIKQAKAEKSR